MEDLDSNDVQMYKVKKAHKPIWTRKTTLWLIHQMKLFERRVDRNQIKKRAVYEELEEKLTNEGFPITWEAIQKKWQNLMSCYWRNIKQPKKIGEWEYLRELGPLLSHTDVWKGHNGWKDSSVASQSREERAWSTERTLFLLEEMGQWCNTGDDVRFRRSIFHRISDSFLRIGAHLDWKTIQKKWHNLVSTYKRNLARPRAEVSWEFFDIMDAVQRQINSAEFAPRSSEREPESAPALPLPWPRPSLLLLLEEMAACKGRRGSLTAAVLFRELQAAFTAMGDHRDWMAILKKWQSLYVTYRKIRQGILNPNSYWWYDRMHAIMHDTDMYCGMVERPSVSVKRERDASVTDTDDACLFDADLYAGDGLQVDGTSGTREYVLVSGEGGDTLYGIVSDEASGDAGSSEGGIVLAPSNEALLFPSQQTGEIVLSLEVPCEGESAISYSEPNSPRQPCVLPEYSADNRISVFADTDVDDKTVLDVTSADYSLAMHNAKRCLSPNGKEELDCAKRLKLINSEDHHRMTLYSCDSLANEGSEEVRCKIEPEDVVSSDEAFPVESLVEIQVNEASAGAVRV